MRSIRLACAFTAMGLMVLMGCGGGGGSTPPPPLQAPAGLAYAANPATYTKGVAIVPNPPASTGGVVASYAVNPALPAGLALNGSTGILSGTPTALATKATYTVTATNAAGSTTTALALTVNDAAPTNLAYASPSVIYTVGLAIPSNAPTSSGGAVVSYGVSPALPAGLSLDPATGILTGTPTALTAKTTYTVTATNTGGSTTAALTLAVVPSGPSITTDPANVTASLGDAATFTVVATGASALSYQWSKNGTPLTGATGASFTTPALALTDSGATYQVVVTDAYGTQATSGTATLTVVQGKFTHTGSLNTERSSATATLLANGKVLIAGGQDANLLALASAEIYDPATGIFTPTGNMAFPRYNHTATSLPDGTVLIAGGQNGS
ncbi:MAG TPA: putative Ig domain-containing protein, partial [Holophagaceae bacterium]